MDRRSIADADLLDVDIAPVVVALDLLDEAVVVIDVARGDDDHAPVMLLPAVVMMLVLELPAGFGGGGHRDGGDEGGGGGDDELFHVCSPSGGDGLKCRSVLRFFVDVLAHPLMMFSHT